MVVKWVWHSPGVLVMQVQPIVREMYNNWDNHFNWGLGGLTSQAAGSNLGPGTSYWKVGSYLPMPGGLQYNMHWFPRPVKYP